MRSSRFAWTLAATILVGSSATANAQEPKLLAPLGATGGETQGGSALFPFGVGPMTFQQLQDRETFSSRTPAVLTTVRWRTPQNYAGQSGVAVELEMRLAQAVPALQTSPTFANNVIGSTEVQVLKRKWLNLPSAIGDWKVGAFPFDAPFAWGYTNLSWRLDVWANNQGNGRVRYHTDLFNEFAEGLPFGTGCGPGPAQLSGAVGVPGGSLSLHALSGTQAALTCYFHVGASTTQWGPLPLPFDLTPFGAPGCTLLNDAILSMPSLSTPFGLSTGSVRLPGDAWLARQTLYAQAVFLDPSANPLGIATTNALRLTILVPQQAWIESVGQGGATTGKVTLGLSVPIGFD